MKGPALLVLALVMAACVSSGDDAEPSTTEPFVAPTTTESVEVPTTNTGHPPMEVSSRAFEPDTPIPVEFTCDGANVSPPITITNLPSGTETVVIVMDDPDAPVGVWDHWVEYDIRVTPPDLDIPQDAGVLGVQGSNSWNLPGYGGPCPPEGEEHTYYIRIYAVDGILGIPAGVDSGVVRDAMSGRILNEIQLTAPYGR